VPALTRATLGDGQVEGWWSRVGQLVEGVGRFALGPSSSLAAASGNNTVGWSLPLPAAAFYGTAGTNHDLGTATLLNSGVQIYFGRVLAEASVSEAKVYAEASSPTVRAPVNATAPFTWKPGDVLSWTFRYVAAS